MIQYALLNQYVCVYLTDRLVSEVEEVHELETMKEQGSALFSLEVWDPSEPSAFT